LTSAPIPDERRRPEADLWADFEAARPRILGALLNAFAVDLSRLPQTHLPALPRMADFALWATACEEGLWLAGTFWSAYSSNVANAAGKIIDGDLVAASVMALMVTQPVWTGTATDLLRAVRRVASEDVVESICWPDSPMALAGRLRRAVTVLRKIGIDISFERDGGRERARMIHITRLDDAAAGHSKQSPASPSPATPTPIVADACLRSVEAAHGNGRAATIRTNFLDNDEAIGAEANIAPLSGSGERKGE
jgi:hypothetical protein